MSHRKPAHRSDRPVFPHVREEIGEDPARFIVAGGELLAARLRGMDRVDVCRKWIEVEVELADVQDRDLNRELVGWLNHRIKHLKEAGDREARLEERREVDPSRRADVEVVDVDGERYSWEEWERKRGGPVAGGSDIDGVEGADEGPVWRHLECGGTNVEMRKAGMSWDCLDCDVRTGKHGIERVDGAA